MKWNKPVASNPDLKADDPWLQLFLGTLISCPRVARTRELEDMFIQGLQSNSINIEYLRRIDFLSQKVIKTGLGSTIHLSTYHLGTYFGRYRLSIDSEGKIRYCINDIDEILSAIRTAGDYESYRHIIIFAARLLCSHLKESPKIIHLLFYIISKLESDISLIESGQGDGESTKQYNLRDMYRQLDATYQILSFIKVWADEYSKENEILLLIHLCEIAKVTDQEHLPIIDFLQEEVYRDNSINAQSFEKLLSLSNEKTISFILSIAFLLKHELEFHQESVVQDMHKIDSLSLSDMSLQPASKTHTNIITKLKKIFDETQSINAKLRLISLLLNYGICIDAGMKLIDSLLKKSGVVKYSPIFIAEDGNNYDKEVLDILENCIALGISNDVLKKVLTEILLHGHFYSSYEKGKKFLDYLFFTLTPKDERINLLKTMQKSNDKKLALLATEHLKLIDSNPNNSLSFTGGFFAKSLANDQAMGKGSFESSEHLLMSLNKSEEKLLPNLLSIYLKDPKKHAIDAIVSEINKKRLLVYLQDNVLFYSDKKKFQRIIIPRNLVQRFVDDFKMMTTDKMPIIFLDKDEIQAVSSTSSQSSVLSNHTTSLFSHSIQQNLVSSPKVKGNKRDLSNPKSCRIT